ncbi:MAG: hypothetical protein ACKO3T_24195, partial [Planctomycetaceae bacterium]
MNRISQFFFGLFVLFGSNCWQCTADEIFRWDFDQTEAGWIGNDQVQLSVSDGHLQLKAKGNDPYFASPVKGRAGHHRLTLSARFKGNADVQVFWTT